MYGGVAALLRRFERAWSSGDAAAMAACWTEDGDLVTTEGARARGEAIHPLLAREHRGPLRGTRPTMQIESLRSIAPGVAFVDATMEVAGFVPSEGGLPRTLAMRVVLLATEQAGIWRFTAARPYVPFRK